MKWLKHVYLSQRVKKNERKKGKKKSLPRARRSSRPRKRSGGARRRYPVYSARAWTSASPAGAATPCACRTTELTLILSCPSRQPQQHHWEAISLPYFSPRVARCACAGACLFWERRAVLDKDPRSLCAVTVASPRRDCDTLLPHPVWCIFTCTPHTPLCTMQHPSNGVLVCLTHFFIL